MYPVNKYIKEISKNIVTNDTYKQHKKIFIVRNRIYYKIRYNIDSNKTFTPSLGCKYIYIKNN
jgi:hypothetical protein